MAKKDSKLPDYWPENDAQTLAQAAAIRADPKRLMHAQTAAAKMAEKASIEAREMRNLARARRTHPK